MCPIFDSWSIPNKTLQTLYGKFAMNPQFSLVTFAWEELRILLQNDTSNILATDKHVALQRTSYSSCVVQFCLCIDFENCRHEGRREVMMCQNLVLAFE